MSNDANASNVTSNVNECYDESTLYSSFNPTFFLAYFDENGYQIQFPSYPAITVSKILIKNKNNTKIHILDIWK